MLRLKKKCRENVELLSSTHFKKGAKCRYAEASLIRCMQWSTCKRGVWYFNPKVGEDAKGFKE